MFVTAEQAAMENAASCNLSPYSFCAMVNIQAESIIEVEGEELKPNES